MKEQTQINPLGSILEQWLSLHPKPSEGGPVMVKTTEEVLQELSEIAEFEINEISMALLSGGYQLINKDGKFGWAFAGYSYEDPF